MPSIPKKAFYICRMISQGPKLPLGEASSPTMILTMKMSFLCMQYNARDMACYKNELTSLLSAAGTVMHAHVSLSELVL